MSDQDHKSLLHTAAEIGSVVAGIGAILNYDKLGQIEAAIRQGNAARDTDRSYEERKAARLRFEKQYQEERHLANQRYLARVANEDNWFAPPEPEPPPIIRAPPRSLRT